MKLELKEKRMETINGVKHYYAHVLKNNKLLEVEITKRQYNRTEIGAKIEIFRDCKYTVLKKSVKEEC